MGSVKPDSESLNSFETDSATLALVVVMINIDFHHFFAFQRPDLYKDTGIGVFWLRYSV